MTDTQTHRMRTRGYENQLTNDYHIVDTHRHRTQNTDREQASEPTQDHNNDTGGGNVGCEDGVTGGEKDIPECIGIVEGQGRDGDVTGSEEATRRREQEA